MEQAITYISFIAIIIVVILLIWTLILNYQERKSRNVTLRNRLAQLRRKIDSLPHGSEDDKIKKDNLYRELFFEYFEHILANIEDLRKSLSAGQKAAADRSKKEKKRAKKDRG